MIDIDNWMRELEEDVDTEARSNEEYQTKLFEEYVLRGSDHHDDVAIVLKLRLDVIKEALRLLG